jgi:hypothetical protein
MKRFARMGSLFSLVCLVCIGCKGTTSSAFNLTSVERDPRTGVVTGATNIGVDVDKNKLSSVNISDVGPGGSANIQYYRSPASAPPEAASAAGPQ